ncbi:MAG TPA: tRNA (adenosine(37)-N6)-threonylcarbamoyltransferase complex dimerization subunit type 1 TsaB [Terriglobales bacterium]|nr:tRNA (adenosine(37)-N6)-threonylcarbamoyltransferase complex dimerization subunit type 1 TsaB [Terriglobales bacterium]
MLLLVVDTSGRQGSVALAVCREKTHTYEIVECVPLTGGTFSAELIPRIAALLTQHNLNLKQVEGFVVVSGPGSFTGLRIGLAAVKGLAEVLERPIAAVSLLEVLAVSSGIKGRVLAMIDAGRNEFYRGEYEIHESRAKVISERLLTRRELLEFAAEATIVTSDKTIADLIRIGELPIHEVAPSMETIAKLGYEKIVEGQIVTPENLEANYIRRSDPEVLREKQFLAGGS